jgi:epoxyqueuosine reductase
VTVADRDLTDRLKLEARRLGFELVGVAPAVVPPGYDRYLDWLEAGRAAGMAYLERQAEARRHPEHIVPGVRSVVVAGMIYGQPDASVPGPTQGKVARYAQGGDYHPVVWRKLEALLAWLQAERPEVHGRAVCDSAPLLERDFARLAGLGWVGKNTCLIDRRAGSFTVLGALLVDLELAYDAPFARDHCGTCTRCLDACPTDAFTAPYQLDARKCLSYWTIEHRGPIPDAMAESLGDWAFGCDICQDVCPWNRKAPAGNEPELAPRPEWRLPALTEWLEADPLAFQKRIKPTALARAKRAGLLRNAALVLGAKGSLEALPALIKAIRDADPLVRWAAAWALGRLPDAEAVEALQEALGDADPLVNQQAERSLRRQAT